MFKAAGPNVDVIIEKTLAAGDYYCELILTIRKYTGKLRDPNNFHQRNMNQ